MDRSTHSSETGGGGPGFQSPDSAAAYAELQRMAARPPEPAIPQYYYPENEQGAEQVDIPPYKIDDAVAVPRKSGQVELNWRVEQVHPDGRVTAVTRDLNTGEVLAKTLDAGTLDGIQPAYRDGQIVEVFVGGQVQEVALEQSGPHRYTFQYGDHSVASMTGAALRNAENEAVRRQQ